MAEKCIELKGITKAFDGQIVLDHMNLDIPENVAEKPRHCE